jgi:hypothetical protein
MEAGSAPSILWHEPVPVQALHDGPVLEVLRHRGPPPRERQDGDFHRAQRNKEESVRWLEQAAGVSPAGATIFALFGAPATPAVQALACSPHTHLRLQALP